MLGLPTGDVAFEGFIFMGALSVVRKRETEPDNSFMIFSVPKFS
jgi:hypothetical protein